MRRDKKIKGILSAITVGVIAVAGILISSLSAGGSPATVVVSAVDGASVQSNPLPEDVRNLLTKQGPLDGTEIGSRVATLDSYGVYLLKKADDTLCVVRANGTSAATACTPRSELTMHGIYLITGDPNSTLSAIVVIPDGYQEVAVGDKVAVVGNNVAVVDISASDRIVKVDGRSDSYSFDLGPLAPPIG